MKNSPNPLRGLVVTAAFALLLGPQSHGVLGATIEWYWEGGREYALLLRDEDPGVRPQLIKARYREGKLEVEPEDALSDRMWLAAIGANSGERQEGRRILVRALRSPRPGSPLVAGVATREVVLWQLSEEVVSVALITADSARAFEFSRDERGEWRARTDIVMPEEDAFKEALFGRSELEPPKLWDGWIRNALQDPNFRNVLVHREGEAWSTLLQTKMPQHDLGLPASGTGELDDLGYLREIEALVADFVEFRVGESPDGNSQRDWLLLLGGFVGGLLLPFVGVFVWRWKKDHPRGSDDEARQKEVGAKTEVAMLLTAAQAYAQKISDTRESPEGLRPEPRDEAAQDEAAGLASGKWNSLRKLLDVPRVNAKLKKQEKLSSVLGEKLRDAQAEVKRLEKALAEAQSSRNRNEAEGERLRSVREELRAQVGDVEASRTDLLAERRQLAEQLNHVQGQLDVRNGDFTSLQERAGSLESQLHTHRAKVDEMEKRLKSSTSRKDEAEQEIQRILSEVARVSRIENVLRKHQVTFWEDNKHPVASATLFFLQYLALYQLAGGVAQKDREQQRAGWTNLGNLLHRMGKSARPGRGAEKLTIEGYPELKEMRIEDHEARLSKADAEVNVVGKIMENLSRAPGPDADFDPGKLRGWPVFLKVENGHHRVVT